MRLKRSLVLVAALATSSALLSAPARAETTVPAPEKLTHTWTAGVTPMRRTDSGRLVPITGISAARMGSSGTSTARGCSRAWVRNSARGLFGSLVYRLRQWTDWCWNRYRKRVYDIRTGYYMENLSSQWVLRGTVSMSRHYYRWRRGYPLRSGYHHYRMIRFENCILKYGCITNDYSKQTVRVRSNGTMTWQTDGDAHG